MPPAQLELVTVTPTATVAELEQLCARTGFSRFPVRNPGGGWHGYVHVKDLLDIPAAMRDLVVEARWVRPLPEVAADAPLRQVLTVLQRTGAHLAQVSPVDQKRRSGLVTLEDVLEELVGEVRDATRRSRLPGAQER